METIDASLTGYFTYIWTIENFPLKTYIDLNSPAFVVKFIGETKWYLKLFADECLHCSLSSNDFSKHNVGINCEFSLLGADGSPLITKSFVEYHWLTMEAFSKRWAEFIPNNTLTVRCRIWRCENEPPNVDFCYARTKLETYKETFTWAVENFSALNSSGTQDFRGLALNEKRVYPVKPLSPKGPFIALITYLNRDNESEGLCVDFLIEKCREYAYYCEISVLDASGDPIVSETDSCRANFSWEFLSFWHLISKDRLTTCKNLFLPNDTLLLKCFFQIYSGFSSSEIEYCTPNITPILESKVLSFWLAVMDADDSFKFGEYFIKGADGVQMGVEAVKEKSESDSRNVCGDSCPLKDALKYLHYEETLWDASLRIGTK